MALRTVGVEEEFFLIDPATRRARPRSGAVLAEHHRRQGTQPALGSHDLDMELFQHQLETRTDPSPDLTSVWAQLLVARATAGQAARSLGLAAVAVATVPLIDDVRLTPDDRYADIVARYADISRHSGTCGMHVHVAIESAEEGVAIIDRIGPWLPALRAVSANSPYADGRDTGYASWRSQLWSHWPSAGPTAPFLSLSAYRQLCQDLIEFGAARDPRMVYFDARLSARHPTVEVRVFDVCTNPADAVFLAALVRGLVERAARGWRAGDEPPAWRTEALRAAHWRASRVGLTEMLVHPVLRRLAPAGEVLAAMVSHVRAELDETGDTALVDEGLRRALLGGGAVQQRAAYARTGAIEGVVDDLVERSEAVWAGWDAREVSQAGDTA
jgi:glutamate---cysteine ligase / carboxylate-amine ligase